jgi:hypothetical protein
MRRAGAPSMAAPQALRRSQVTIAANGGGASGLDRRRIAGWQA